MDTTIVIVCAMFVCIIFSGLAGWGAGWAARQATPTEDYAAGYQAGMLAVNNLIRGAKPDGTYRFDIVQVGEPAEPAAPPTPPTPPNRTMADLVDAIDRLPRGRLMEVES